MQIPEELYQQVCEVAFSQAIISVGKTLGLTVVAEGVETAEQKTFLRDHACNEMQGVLFSKPLPPKQLADLLRPTPLLISPPLSQFRLPFPEDLGAPFNACESRRLRWFDDGMACCSRPSGT